MIVDRLYEWIIVADELMFAGTDWFIKTVGRIGLTQQWLERIVLLWCIVTDFIGDPNISLTFRVFVFLCFFYVLLR